MIGLLGPVRFQVNDRKVLAFHNFKREISSSWASVDRIGRKPLTEYSGPELQKATLEIVLNAGLGVKPRKLIETLERMTESGEAYDFVLGKRRIGRRMWTVTKCSQAYDIVLRGGEIYKATLSLTLQEYV